MTATSPGAGPTRPVVMHVTTTDISLALLLGPQLAAFRDAGYEVIGVSAPGPYVPQLGASSASATCRSARDPFDGAVPRRRRARRAAARLRRDSARHRAHAQPEARRVRTARGPRSRACPSIVNTVHGLYAQPDDPWARRAVVYSLERVAATCSHAELVQNVEDIPVLRRLGDPRREAAPARQRHRPRPLRPRPRSRPTPVPRLRREMGRRRRRRRVRRRRSPRVGEGLPRGPRRGAHAARPVAEAADRDRRADRRRQGRRAHAGRHRRGRSGSATCTSSASTATTSRSATRPSTSTRSRRTARASRVPRWRRRRWASRSSRPTSAAAGRWSTTADGPARRPTERARWPTRSQRAGATSHERRGARWRSPPAPRRCRLRPAALHRPARSAHLRVAARRRRNAGGGMTETNIRFAELDDAWRLADMHARRINEGFLASLGPVFLGRLYRRVIRSPHARSQWWPSTTVASSRSARPRRTSAGCTATSWCATGSSRVCGPRRAWRGRSRTWSRRCATPRRPARCPTPRSLAVVTDEAAAGTGLRFARAARHARRARSARLFVGEGRGRGVEPGRAAALRTLRLRAAPADRDSRRRAVGSAGVGSLVAFGAALGGRGGARAARPARLVRARCARPAGAAQAATRIDSVPRGRGGVRRARGRPRADPSDVARPARARSRARRRRRHPLDPARRPAPRSGRGRLRGRADRTRARSRGRRDHRGHASSCSSTRSTSSTAWTAWRRVSLSCRPSASRSSAATRAVLALALCGALDRFPRLQPSARAHLPRRRRLLPPRFGRSHCSPASHCSRQPRDDVDRGPAPRRPAAGRHRDRDRAARPRPECRCSRATAATCTTSSSTAVGRCCGSSACARPRTGRHARRRAVCASRVRRRRGSGCRRGAARLRSWSGGWVSYDGGATA